MNGFQPKQPANSDSHNQRPRGDNMHSAANRSRRIDRHPGQAGSFAQRGSADMKLSDYIVERLAEWNVGHIFLVTGGGAMHLNDSIGKETRIHYVCNHHEQASAMAAEAYARVSGRPGVVNVTTGPGGINALNGVFGAWTDSVPMLVISGQVKRETCMRSRGLTGLRQLGDQEADIIAMVGGITKYAAFIDDPQSIRYHLERAWHLAQSGRPGPCWLDVPVDVQAASIDPESLRAYDPAEDGAQNDRLTRLLPASFPVP